MEENTSKKIGRAAKWSAITEVATKLVTPVTNAILARLLAPEAFGVVATLTMVTSFAEIFTDAGFQKYLVQHNFQDDEDLDLSTNVAFWTNMTVSLLIWGIIALFATPIANLVGSPKHEAAIVIISAEIPILAFSSIQQARLRRDFDFKKIFYVRMGTAFVPLIVTVPAALLLQSYWALVAGTLAKDIISAIVLLFKAKWKPSFRFDYGKLKNMLSFSIWTIIENITIWLSGNAGVFIIGGILGSYYLGMYKTTVSTVNSYFNIIQGAAMPVLFSALSRCQDSHTEFCSVYYKFQRMIALLTFPLSFGIFVYRELATFILLGSQWFETADFLGLRSLTRAFLIVFSYTASEAFRSKGMPKLSVLSQALFLLCDIPILYWGAKHGYEALSVCSSFVCIILIAINIVLISRVIKIRIMHSLRNILPPLFSSVFMAFTGLVLQPLFPGMFWELFTVFLCVLVYFGCMYLVPSGRKQLLEIPFLKKIIRSLT